MLVIRLKDKLFFFAIKIRVCDVDLLAMILILIIFFQDEMDVLSLIFDIGKNHASFAVSITKEFIPATVVFCSALSQYLYKLLKLYACYRWNLLLNATET